jgi:hypothetical protein
MSKTQRRNHSSMKSRSIKKNSTTHSSNSRRKNYESSDSDKSEITIQAIDDTDSDTSETETSTITTSKNNQTTTNKNNQTTASKNNQTTTNKNNQTTTNKNSDDDTSDKDSDSYKTVLMSSLLALSNKNKITDNEDSQSTDITNDLKPTESRIEFVKRVLDGTKLKPMINFDQCDTEIATSARLGKKIMDDKKLFSSMNVKLKYVKSGTTGHTFKAVSKVDKNISLAVKVCAYPKDDYGAIGNIKRPENTELRMIRCLGTLVAKGSTPHIVLPVGMLNTSIKNFIKIPKELIDLDDDKNEMYKTFIERYHNDEFEEFVSVLISEWCTGGDLLDYIRKNYQNMNLRQWKVIFFQLLFTLALIHKKYPAFRHNDMKANNILVQLTNLKKNNRNKVYRYNMDDTKFLIPDIDMLVKIWDFDFACIAGTIENNKVNAKWTKKINISNKENKYYDIHYFFNTLSSKRFFPDFYNGGVPNEIVQFVQRVIPQKFRHGSKYVNKKGRIQVDTEYTTPYKLIMEDELFSKYRYKNI